MSSYAPDGLCAACLLESALEERDTDAREASRSGPLLAFNDYELLEEIARGGMGVVYRARQISLNRTVAIKMILGGHLANVAEMKRFRAEAETAAQLQHPNIVAIHEVGEHAGQPFFSMDLIEGRNLAQLARDEPLPSRKAATYLKTIAEAVQYAHSHDVLHRDLKPSNILIDDADQPRITDFGLAKHLASQLSTADPQLTQTGQVLGSPSFIPPEQAAGHKEAIGPASDVYSLGAILYHCLTARPPFVADTMTQTLRMVAEQDPVSPRLLNASVPRDLETICLKCLEKDPRRRYATAQELADELGRFLANEPIRARPVGRLLRLHRWCLRNKALAVSGTAALALLLAVAVGSPIAALRISRERAQAEAARQEAETNARKATIEAAKSRQVAAFFEDMVHGASPRTAMGRDTTVLREILDMSSERVGQDLTNQPAVEAELLTSIGHIYEQIGRLDRAEALLRQALEIERNLPGDERIELSKTLQYLGMVLDYRGQSNESVAALRESLSIRRQILGDENLDVADSHTDLGYALYQRQPVEAEATLREALRLKMKLAGSDYLSLATTYRGLGFTLQQQGKLEQAEAAFRESYTLFQQNARNHGADELTTTLFALDSLVDVLVQQKKFAEAEKLFSGTMTPDDINRPQVAPLLDSRADLFARQGRWQKSIADATRAVEFAPTNQFYNQKLTVLQVAAGDFEGYRRQCQNVQARFGRTKNSVVAERMAKVCLTLPESGADFEVINRMIQVGLTPATNQQVSVYSQFVAGLAEYRQGRFTNAIEWMQKVLSRAGEDDYRDAEAWAVLAMARYRLDDTDDAHADLAKSLEINRTKVPKLENGDAGPWWNYWIITQALVKEADVMINGRATYTDPFEPKR